VITTTRDPDVPVPHVLREYAVTADGERGVVIGPQGDYAWMCLPSWESPAVYGGLVGCGPTCPRRSYTPCSWRPPPASPPR
jgi:hypothetical protein